jgi:hypothetical protein
VALATASSPPLFDAIVDDALRAVLGRLDEDDILCAALVCRRFRDTLWLYDDRQTGGVRVRTTRACGVVSVQRLRWAATAGWRDALVSSLTCAAAARAGSLGVLKYARAIGCAWDERLVCCEAAAGGHLSTLVWARQAAGCAWDERTCARAASGGHLTVLQWATRHGAPEGHVDTLSDARAGRGGGLQLLAIEGAWDHSGGGGGESLALCAARAGHTHILEWCLATGRLAHADQSLCTAAAVAGRHAVLQWALVEHRFERASAHELARHAARNGRVRVLSWLRDELPDEPWRGAAVCASAAAGGEIDALRWLRDVAACAWDEDTCAHAARGGRLRALQFARARGCPWCAETCAMAARCGELEVLQWARAHGCVWTDAVCSGAAAGGHLEVLQWARANGCPWDAPATSASAVYGLLHACWRAVGRARSRTEHVATLRWTLEHGYASTDGLRALGAEGAQDEREAEESR